MAKNLSFPNNESVSNFYSKIQKKVQDDLKEDIVPYQYQEFYDFFKEFKNLVKNCF
jgi:hypothetical protein